MKVMVVDDSSTMRALLSTWLRGDGHVVVATAADGSEALTLLESLVGTGNEPELMLVDWNMPVLDGIELVKAVRASRKWARTKIIMVTAENDRAKIARAIIAGADEYMMKPADKDVLASKISLLQDGL